MNRKNFLNKHTIIWAVFHFFVIAAFLVSLIFTKGVIFDGDFSSMMPAGSQDESVQIAEKAINSSSGNSIFILVSHKDFSQAKKTAVTVYENLILNKNAFENISLYTEDQTADDVADFLAASRFNLLDKAAQDFINGEGGAEEFAQNALAQIYGGFSLNSLANLSEDPFNLDGTNLENFLKAVSDSGTALGPKDGVLATEYEGNWFVMLRGNLTKAGAALSGNSNAVPFIYETCLPLEQDGIRFAFYGTPFHSYHASKNAGLEISIISTVSLAAVIVILLLVFRSPLPLFASLLSIALSVVTAFCATHLIFRQIHMTSLVFGTSLIGSCIDYSLHYFINWKGEKSHRDTFSIRRHLFNGLILSLVSTEICFALLGFAPFSMLRQMAVFSFAGILSSFLTVNGCFVLFELPPEEKRVIPVFEWIKNKQVEQKSEEAALPEPQKTPVKNSSCNKILRYIPMVIFAACVLFLALNYKKISIHNDIKNLYQMSGRLKSDTELAYKVINYAPSNWIIVSGTTAEEVLQKEEEIIPLLPSCDRIIATSRFIPSKKMQLSSTDTCLTLLPLAEEQFENIGFGREELAAYTKAVKSSHQKLLTPESQLPQSLEQLLKILWIGQNNGRYYSIILPGSISDMDLYKKLCSDDDNLYFQNKVEDICNGLDKLTGLIVLFFAIAFAIIAVVMKFFFSWKDTLKILSVPVLAVMVIASVFIALGLNIEFFCITGVILVFGMGLDYIIYSLENKGNRLEEFAIELSFVTTAISFGSLALSSFVPVKVIGLSVLAGLCCAILCSKNRQKG